MALVLPIPNDDYLLERSPERKNQACLATPLVEVLSVDIYTNDDDNNASEVYGTIQVIDGEGAVFDLYMREENDEEIVSAKGGSITLTLWEGRAISPFYQVEMEIDIKDKARKSATIAKGVLCWDYRTKDDYDQVQIEYVHGQCGCAAIRYITYRYAVIATVDVLLHRGRSDDASCDEFADVYGKIVARCESNVTNSSILFENSLNQSVRVKYGTCIDLSRYVVAVPVYSTFVIATDLWNGDTEQQICCEDKRFAVIEYTPSYLSQDVTGKNGVVEVRVSYSLLYMQPPPERKLKHRIEDASNEENAESKNKGKKRQLISDRAPFSSSSSVSWNLNPHSDIMRSPVERLRCEFVMEVFSVVISNNNNEGGFNLWGTIKVEHTTGKFFIFNRDKKSAERLLGNQTAATITGLTTADHGCFRDIYLLLGFNLKDTEGHEISAGSMEWSYSIFYRLPLFDMQLCSIIPGDSGYAAVHYTLFSAAVQATVKICFVTESHSTSLTTNCFQVHGSVYTEYSNYKYVTRYDKQHYRSKLFQRNPENPELLPSSSHEFEVPLLKNMVAVPLNSLLIVDLTLSFAQDVDHSNFETTTGETFQGRLKFSTHNFHTGSKMCEKIQGNHQNKIAVYVEWSEVSIL